MIPRIHAALMAGSVAELWNRCDSHTRLLWCSLAHVPTYILDIDYFNGPEMEAELQDVNFLLMPFQHLPESSRMKLSITPSIMINFLRNMAQLPQLASLTAREND
jgi:hypothetical protein